jgi:hypothetical protein
VIGEAFFTLDERDTFFESAKKFAEMHWMLDQGFDLKKMTTPEEVEAAYAKLGKWIEEGGELLVDYTKFTDHMYEVCLSSGDDLA